jgi:hypothetical protein
VDEDAGPDENRFFFGVEADLSLTPCPGKELVGTGPTGNPLPCRRPGLPITSGLPRNRFTVCPLISQSRPSAPPFSACVRRREGKVFDEEDRTFSSPWPPRWP